MYLNDENLGSLAPPSLPLLALMQKRKARK